MSSSKVNGQDNRKRKQHTKSRKGCGNCKLRRIKCDEGKPECTKCISYGVTCNYDEAATNELHLPGESAFSFVSKPRSSGPGHGPELYPKDSMSPDTGDEKLNTMLAMPLKLHDTEELYYMTEEDIELIRLFKDRAVYTLATAQSVETYRRELTNMSLDFPYLTHCILAFTVMYSRCTSTVDSQPWAKESYHWLHGSAIYGRLLSQPIQHKDKDPLWGTAALLGAITIASIEATSPEQAWPLATSSDSDLDWLRMSDGKKAVWAMVNPLRPESVWRDVVNYEQQKDPEPYDHVVPELNMLYPFLVKMYNYDPFSQNSEEAQDPYHTAASILTRLLELECNHTNVLYFLSFLGHMDPRFRELLHHKDAKAMLLLAWWYGKMCTYNVWWQKRRMMLEGQAICIYIERNHGDQEDVVKLLDYPKIMTGLIGS